MLGKLFRIGDLLSGPRACCLSGLDSSSRLRLLVTFSWYLLIPVFLPAAAGDCSQFIVAAHSCCHLIPYTVPDFNFFQVQPVWLSCSVVMAMLSMGSCG